MEMGRSKVMLSFRSTMVVPVLVAILLFETARSPAQSDCNGNGIDDACDLSCGPPDLPRHTCREL